MSKEPQILTVSCKLRPTSQQAQDFTNLSSMFAATCNYINASVDPKYKSAIKLQKLIYADAKSKSGMQANHVIQACIRVAGNRKLVDVKEFKSGSVLYDARTFSLSKDSDVVSLSVIGKRIKVAMVLGKFQREMLSFSVSTPSSATLVRKGANWYLNVQIKAEVEQDSTPITNNNYYLGVDLGRKDIASLSNGQSFSGKQIEKVRTKYSNIRARLQHKASSGTRSSRRRCRQLQKRLAGKDRRFQAWLNHNISLRIVLNAAYKSYSHIVLEDLEGITERTNTATRSREQRFLANSWSFYQKRAFYSVQSKYLWCSCYFGEPKIYFANLP